MRESDWPDVYQLIEDNMFEMQRALGLKWHRDNIIRYFKNRSILVATDRNKFSGFIAFHQIDDYHFIDSLQVAKEDQNGLVGFRLLKASLLRVATSPEIQKICCCVFDNNTAAKQMYFSVGFTELSRSDGILKIEIPVSHLTERFGLQRAIKEVHNLIQ